MDLGMLDLQSRVNDESRGISSYLATPGGRADLDQQFQDLLMDTRQEDNEGPGRGKDRHQVLNKVKSELCRKFVQNGACPYGFKCKFAHGIHQLRQNQHANNRYKTKQCGTFFKEGYCRFGNRCNFLHIKAPDMDQKKAIHLTILSNHRDCIYGLREESKLLRALERQHI